MRLPVFRRMAGRLERQVPGDIDFGLFILAGTPVFAGSRLPIATVLGSLDAGESWERLIANWPFLTQEHVRAARDWSAAHDDTRVRAWLDMGTPRETRKLGKLLSEMPNVGRGEDFKRSSD
jgi:uncharacterized protein (DUF433 family)